MVAARGNLFPVNGGPGSMLATKFGKEEVGGRLGKGFCRLAAALAPPFSAASNTNGGLKVISATFPPKLMGVAEMPYPPRRTQAFEENVCHAEAVPGSGWPRTGGFKKVEFPTGDPRG